MPFLTRALQHAAGMDLSRFHVTFVSKCLPKVDGMVLPRRQKRDWASVCASQYLTQELRALAPKQIFIFGEMAIRVCFPNLETKWEDLLFQTKTMEPLGIEAHFFDQPTRLQKLGLSGEEGEALLSKLNQQLGGELSPPDQDQNLDLFDLL
jgi:uracil-DNA glycosylase